MALFNFGKKKEEEKKTPACACSCGCAASEAESITNDCCPDLKEGEICCIKVLAGCKSCHEQFEYTKQAVKDMGLSVEVEYITDMQKVGCHVRLHIGITVLFQNIGQFIQLFSDFLFCPLYLLCERLALLTLENPFCIGKLLFQLRKYRILQIPISPLKFHHLPRGVIGCY